MSYLSFILLGFAKGARFSRGRKENQCNDQDQAARGIGFSGRNIYIHIIPPPLPIFAEKDFERSLKALFGSPTVCQHAPKLPL